MDIKKQELDLRKQEQEKMAIAQNQQTYMFNQMLKQQQEQQQNNTTNHSNDEDY